MSLVVDHLSIRFDARRVLEGVSFAVETGRALALRGPNGAGKTTLLRAVAGLIQTDAVRLDGQRIADLPPGAVQFSGHRDGISAALTVRENLAFWAGLVGGDVDAALDAMDLARFADRPAARLSAGQKRRTGLARLALTPARLWLLDEPTNALDSASIARLGTMLQAHLAQGGIALIATHADLSGFGVATDTLTLAPPTRRVESPFLEPAS
ncbi:heme ABC exporter ATP-binding protein CcmA [Paracoccaceae bacterium GXU_MW_L88]